jgi:hypothetical protein
MESIINSNKQAREEGLEFYDEQTPGIKGSPKSAMRLTKINGKTATVNVVANVPDNIFGIPIPAAPTPKTLPKPKKKPGNVNNGFFSNIPGFASGGDIGAGTLATVNERGPEMFMPRTDGFIMNASDSKRLVSGVEQLLSGGGGQTFNITTTDPVLTAAEVVRRQRDAQFLLGR